MQSYWFGDTGDGCCQAAEGDSVVLAQRLDSLQTKMDNFVPLKWEDAIACGICTDRAGYLTLLREVCFIRAEQRIREEYAGKDTELLQMVRTLDEMDEVINLLSERVAEWHQVRHPTFSRKYRKTPVHIQIRRISEKGRGSLGKVALQVEQLSAARTDLAKEVSLRATRVLPNTSALIGGLVAARLMAQAGGLLPLSRLPSSVIQVLGARTALFSHLRTRSPPPKHGIIFQHRRVHNAPRDLRGKVARVLAAKLAIAARLDYYRGVAVPEFLDRAQERIDRLGGKES
ncbi:MAG TPA: RNA-processing protein [Methanoregula sp.]|nr:RNA-processing protein [Methanoregula sp.]